MRSALIEIITLECLGKCVARGLPDSMPSLFIWTVTILSSDSTRSEHGTIDVLAPRSAWFRPFFPLPINPQVEVPFPTERSLVSRLRNLAAHNLNVGIYQLREIPRGNITDNLDVFVGGQKDASLS